MSQKLCFARNLSLLISIRLTGNIAAIEIASGQVKIEGKGPLVVSID